MKHCFLKSVSENFNLTVRYVFRGVTSIQFNTFPFSITFDCD